MVSVITLAPIAAQLARLIPLNDLFPRDAVEQALRGAEQAAGPGEPKLPADIQPFYEHYCVVVRAATRLLRAPAFDVLARFHEDVEEQYMPGGPPQSPVYDSFAMQFVLGAVRQGFALPGTRNRSVNVAVDVDGLRPGEVDAPSARKSAQTFGLNPCTLRG